MIQIQVLDILDIDTSPRIASRSNRPDHNSGPELHPAADRKNPVACLPADPIHTGPGPDT
jgi:hypothetical protein